MDTSTFPRESPPLTAVAFLATWLAVVAVNPTGFGVVFASAIAVAAASALIDLRTGRLPDALAALATVPVVIAAVAGEAIGSALLGALLMAGPLLIVHLWSPSAMGFGDVKLAAVLGAVAGLIDPIWSLVALCIASGVTAAVGLIRRSSALPFGPGLVAGALAVVLISPAFRHNVSEGRLPWR